MVKPPGQTAGQDAPDGVSLGYGHKSSDLTQLAALWHLRYFGVSVQSSGQPVERQIPIFIQCLADRVRGSSEVVPGSEDGERGKICRLLTSHWTSAITTCTK
jgi:hypothetical protein